MNSEDVIIYLTALVAFGIIFIGILAVIFHSATLVPIVIIGIILLVLVMLSKMGYSHQIEVLEKICFLITFIAIICTFILLYKPM